MAYKIVCNFLHEIATRKKRIFVNDVMLTQMEFPMNQVFMIYSHSVVGNKMSLYFLF